MGPLADASALGLKTLSRLRGKRIFHPFGVGFSARLTPLVEGGIGADALDREGPAIVRLSRALGLPEWLPDPCGMALRIPDAHGPGRHQDLLMVSSAAAPFGRHAVLPARGFFDRPYSTLLPYELRGDLVLFGARPVGTSGPGPKLGELRARERAGIDLQIELASLQGEWSPVAALSLERRLPAEQAERLGFDPTNTGGGLSLAGWLNRLRGPSYRASQEGRVAAQALPIEEVIEAGLEEEAGVERDVDPAARRSS